LKHWKTRKTKEKVEIQVLLEKQARRMIDLYLKLNGDIDAIHEALERRGWKVTKNKGMLSNSCIFRGYTFIFSPTSIEVSQDTQKYPDPMWVVKVGGGEEIRLLRPKWEELLEPTWR
jgi:hypothetical protein